jgi:cytochrome c peroxidase
MKSQSLKNICSSVCFTITIPIVGIILSVCLACFTGNGLFAEMVLANKSNAQQVPIGLERLKVPANNKLTAAKIELGKQLFFEKRLSSDNTVSCATCHDPEKGWSNNAAFATGVRGQVGGRSAPTIINAAYHPLQFWDGRAVGLEGQALGPIANPIEMNLSIADAIARLSEIPGYRKQFKRVFGTKVTAEAMAQAIASFERTVVSGDAPFDRFKAGDKNALNASAQRGMDLFFNKAKCSACHKGGSFSDFAFHNLGVGINNPNPDLGRFAVTKQEGDRGSFKTPTLREIHRTAPYMHDGSQKTLKEVVEFYNKGGIKNPQLDEEMKPLKLSPDEVNDIVNFMVEGLASEHYPQVSAPQLPE